MKNLPMAHQQGVDHALALLNDGQGAVGLDLSEGNVLKGVDATGAQLRDEGDDVEGIASFLCAHLEDAVDDNGQRVGGDGLADAEETHGDEVQQGDHADGDKQDEDETVEGDFAVVDDAADNAAEHEVANVINGGDRPALKLIRQLR